MEERLVRKPLEEQVKPSALRLRRLGELMASGGFSALDSKPTPERIAEIEAQGFSMETVQTCLDKLERMDQIEDAALLRGAFNDLLSQIPDYPTEESSETEAA